MHLKNQVAIFETSFSHFLKKITEIFTLYNSFIPKQQMTLKTRAWVEHAIQVIETDFNRSADTHLLRFEFPKLPQINFYFKDESTHPTGSLKHRLARSLFLHGLCSGWITSETTIVESSSGSTAVSEAYFAQLLGLPFIAVMPKSTSQSKIEAIEFYGGQAHFVENSKQARGVSEELASNLKGRFMDQFTYAERAVDWRGNNNIASSIYEQMAMEPHPIPKYIILGAGTGGTSATIGRFIRYSKTNTKLCVADPEGSVFFDYYHQRDPDIQSSQTTMVIEGVGRPTVEPSFIPEIVDRMICVKHAQSFATLKFLQKYVGRKLGGSTGTNFYAAVQLVAEMAKKGETGSVLTLICDSGDRYLETYYNQQWLKDNGYHIDDYFQQLELFYQQGQWEEVD